MTRSSKEQTFKLKIAIIFLSIDLSLNMGFVYTNGKHAEKYF